MYPLALDLRRTRILFVGGGEKALRRLKQLDEANALKMRLFAEEASDEFKAYAGDRLEERLPTEDDLRDEQLVIIVDVDDARAFEIANMAREAGMLVNVEDRRDYCDFHFPAYFRRGDLLVAVSTNGASPVVASYVKEKLQGFIGQEWEDIVAQVAKYRDEWREAGLSMKVVKEKTLALIERLRKAS